MKKIYGIPLVLLFAPVLVICGGVDLLKEAGAKLRKPAENIFLDVVEEKRKVREQLEEDKKELAKDKQEFDEFIAVELEGVDKEIMRTKIALKKAPEDEFINKRLTIYNELYQVLKDLQKARDSISIIINEHIKLLDSYLDDTDFVAFKKEHKFKDYYIYYSFDDLQYLHTAILEQKHHVTQLIEQEKNANTEKSHRKQGATAAKQAYKQKQEEREKAVQASVSDVDTQRLTELLNLEERLYKNRQRLDELHFKEIEHKVQLVESKKFVAQEKLRILQYELRRIKPSIRITESDLALAKEGLGKKQNEHVRMQGVYRKRLNIILAEKQEKEKTLATFSKRYNVTLGEAVDEWRTKPEQNVLSYIGICQVGVLNSYLLLLNTKRQLLEVQDKFEDIKLNDERIQVKIKESFFKIVSRRFVSEEAIAQEIQSYEAPKAEAQANLSLYKAKVQEADELLAQQKKVLEALGNLRKDIQSKQGKLFRTAVREYFTCLEVINRAEMAVKERIDVLKQLASTYGTFISVINDTLRHTNFIVAELNSITIWHRPEYAISWAGVKNVVPDVEAFLSDVSAYVRAFNIRSFITVVYQSISRPFESLFLMIKLLALILCLLLLGLYLPRVRAFLLGISMERTGLWGVMSTLGAAISGFIHAYFVSIALWVVLFAAMMMQMVLDPYLYVLFYLFSIPYLLYVANRCIQYIVNFNIRHDYILLSQEFQRRFILVFSTLLYATIAIVFFREAFMLFMMLANYYKSELPNILLAINFIIFQISLILLISKEQILSLMPFKSEFWQWVRKQFDRYYALILLVVIAIIVMGNPYVGFGRLVLYFLRGLLYTGLLLSAFFWLYGVAKRTASHLFFAREGEIVRERFAQAKTWFGLLIIALFLVLGFIGFVIVARVWGWQIAFEDIGGWLNQSLFPGVKPPITIMSFLQFIAVVMSGFTIASGLNRFVLDKIFDLLLIDMGVQHTVTSIMRYMIIVTAVFLGFHQVGLGSLVLYLVGALALGIGWILKEPISDFVAYFIILVQRPVKIGDFIKVDEDTVGVVRQITPRSIVLRRKNSTTIVLPNSYLVNHAITNWNYLRKFIAFNDILIRIHYTEDPRTVTKLLRESVEDHPKVLKNPKPIVRLDEFGEYGYIFMVRGFLSDVYTLDQWDIASEIRFAIVKNLRDHKIKIAVPVRAYVGLVQGPSAVDTSDIPEGSGMKE